MSRSELERRFFAAANLITGLDDRIGDLEYALRDANIDIPDGRSAASRDRRIEHGYQVLRDNGLDI